MIIRKSNLSCIILLMLSILDVDSLSMIKIKIFQLYKRHILEMILVCFDLNILSTDAKKYSVSNLNGFIYSSALFYHKSNNILELKISSRCVRNEIYLNNTSVVNKQN